MNQKLQNLPGYHEETIGEKQGVSADSGINDQQLNLFAKLIGTKADKEVILKIEKEKTNKSDSEHQMKLVETMHKMLKSLAVLVTEITK